MNRDLSGVRRLARVLDAQFRVPGTDWRFGIDALIGLVPGIGDVIGVVLSAYIIVVAARQGVSKATLVRMMINVGIEALVGAVPIFGDIFDAAFKANLRNVALLEREVEAGRPLASSRFGAFVVVALLAVLSVGAGVLGVAVLRAVLARL
jgi:hypothetical protein